MAHNDQEKVYIRLLTRAGIRGKLFSKKWTKEDSRLELNQKSAASKQRFLTGDFIGALVDVAEISYIGLCFGFTQKEIIAIMRAAYPTETLGEGGLEEFFAAGLIGVQIEDDFPVVETAQSLYDSLSACGYNLKNARLRMRELIGGEMQFDVLNRWIIEHVYKFCVELEEEDDAIKIANINAAITELLLIANDWKEYDDCEALRTMTETVPNIGDWKAQYANTVGLIYHCTNVHGLKLTHDTFERCILLTSDDEWTSFLGALGSNSKEFLGKFADNNDEPE